ncbi:hypothetical protein [Halarchaeum acidiphilum]|nr:hypothetical protein [Halarchaeum acidiphilum]
MGGTSPSAASKALATRSTAESDESGAQMGALRVVASKWTVSA